MSSRLTGALLSENGKAFLNGKPIKGSTKGKVKADAKRTLNTMPEIINRFFEDFRIIQYSYPLRTEEERKQLEENFITFRKAVKHATTMEELIFPTIIYQNNKTMPEIYKKMYEEANKATETAKTLCKKKSKYRRILYEIHDKTYEHCNPHLPHKLNAIPSREIDNDWKYAPKILQYLKAKKLIELKRNKEQIWLSCFGDAVYNNLLVIKGAKDDKDTGFREPEED